ncbi:MAG: hypothetical protein CVU39_18820 [Chloroflexi bacterium HGW-Chloroflexi-10]|nr:MAG: hypothetical protein CVU39_18820 [Chloroflexi bacterium HGW-Chloroflexi-10]
MPYQKMLAQQKKVLKSPPYWRRVFRAQVRDLQVLLREFWRTLLLFVVILLLGALLMVLFYTDPYTAERITFIHALYGVFGMVFFENTLEFPNQLGLQILFFLIPIMGVGVLAEGLIRFAVALTDKQSRGEKWQVAMASTYKNHVVVCGFGKVGYRVTMELLKFGREVVAIELHPEARFLEKAKEMGVPIIIADARRTANLIKANVKFADAIVPCTNDELANLDIALDARELNPGIKVVMRMFDPDLAKRIEKGFGIHTAFSSSALTAPIVAAQAMRLNVQHSFYVGEKLLNLSQMVVQPGSRWLGWTLEQLYEVVDLTVVYYRNGTLEDMHPNPQLVLEAGAEVLVLADVQTLQEVNRLNGG